MTDIENNNDTLKEYIVTLKKFEDLEEFYHDMETIGGNLHIPNRAVDLFSRRPISRNTHYMLSTQEAQLLRQDLRVASVTLNSKDRRIIAKTHGFVQTSDHFSKITHSNPRDVNWGLLRCMYKNPIPNWGTDADLIKSATIRSETSGKNVDVVIMDDGSPYPNTLEFRKNVDGTGYSRVIEYPWQGITYDYNVRRIQEHNAHTAGTVAGNTQGWAKDANIYTISFIWDTDAELGLAIDAVKLFHRNKSINPITGLKNPTVMNNSWGYSGSFLLRQCSKLVYRGVSYFPDSGSFGSYIWTTNFNNFRIVTFVGQGELRVNWQPRVDFLDEDFIDLIDEGIIVVSSAGNSGFYHDRPGGPDYNNYFLFGNNDIEDNRLYVHRGSSPAAAAYKNPSTGVYDYSRRVISVGSSGSTDGNPGSIGNPAFHERVNQLDYKSRFSNYGPRIDVYAPGQSIQSVWEMPLSGIGDVYYAKDNTAFDRRCTEEDDVTINNFVKIPGTSMAGPQVSGILACIAEKYPRMKQADALDYIQQNSLSTLVSTNGGTTDGRDAGLTYNTASADKIIFFKQDRFDSENQLQKVLNNQNTFKSRPITGKLFPRQKNVLIQKNTSLAASVSSNTNSINDGGSFNITVNANVSNGSKIPYIITAKQSVLHAGKLEDLDLTATFDEPVSGIFYDDEPISGLELVDTRGGRAHQYTFNTETRTGSQTSIAKNFIGPNFSNKITKILEDEGSRGSVYRYLIQLPNAVKFLGFYYNEITVYDHSFLCFGNTGQLGFFDGVSPLFPRINISSREGSALAGSGPRARLVTVRETSPGNYVIGYYGNTHTSLWNNDIIGTCGGLLEWELHIGNSDTFSIHIEYNEFWQTFGKGNQEILPTYYNVPVIGEMTVNNGTATLPVTFDSDSAIVNSIVTFRLNYFDAPYVDIAVTGDRPFYRIYSDKDIYFIGDTIEFTLECTNVPDGTLIRWIGASFGWTDFSYYEVNGVGGDGDTEPSASYQDAIRGLFNSEVDTPVVDGKIVWRFTIEQSAFGENTNGVIISSVTIEFPDIPDAERGIFEDFLFGRVTIYDAKLDDLARVISYNLSAYNSTDLNTPINSATEGDTIVIKLQTSNVPFSFPIPYTITGVGLIAGDIDVPLNGVFRIQATGQNIGLSEGEDLISILIIQDGLAEFGESLTLTLDSPAIPNATSITITLNDS